MPPRRTGMHNYSTAVGHKPTQNTVTGGYILAQDILTCFSNFFHGQFKLIAHVTKHAENAKASEERCHRVAAAEDDALLSEVVVEFVVGSQGNHASETNRIGVEDLSPSIIPYL